MEQSLFDLDNLLFVGTTRSLLCWRRNGFEVPDQEIKWLQGCLVAGSVVHLSVPSSELHMFEHADFPTLSLLDLCVRFLVLEPVEVPWLRVQEILNQICLG